MIDLKKIDFAKLRLPDWTEQWVTCKRGPLGLELKRFHHRFAHRPLDACGAWQYCGPSTWTELEVAKTYTDRVDAFIVEETARIAAEDEAANFVSVPWQDVEWLENQRVEVYEFHDEHREFVRCGPFRSCATRYHADKRTLPTGYDPTKPRWVEINWTQVERLDKAGCQLGDVADKSYGYRPRKPNSGAGKRDWCYAVDIHTLPPGVPLHVDPPKPEPRPCTREFALAHPGESEFRYWSSYEDCGSARGEWSKWRAVSGDSLADYQCNEFRTTASEPEKRRVTVDFDGKRWGGGVN